MTTTERHGRLTYERLVNSLERLQGTISTQFPDLKDAGRAQDLQQVIGDALATAQSGISGAPAISPAQLKQQVKSHITQIHKRYDTFDENEVYTPADMLITRTSSALGTAHTHFLPSPAPQHPASKLPRGTRDSSKENAAPSSNQSSRKPSAVKKTTILKREPSSKPSKPSASGGIKKRTARPSRSKPVKQHLDPRLDLDLAESLPSSPADEEDRRLAATALLGLADSTPSSSFSLSSFSLSKPPSSGLTPSTAGTKRSFAHDEEDDLTSPAQKRRVSAPEAPRSTLKLELPSVPVLERVSIETAFVRGVEYALALLPLGVAEAAEVREWVVRQTDVRRVLGEDVGKKAESCSFGGGVSVRGDVKVQGGVPSIQLPSPAQTGQTTHGAGTSSAAGKGFWDIVW